jgi:hypothetical protein
MTHPGLIAPGIAQRHQPDRGAVCIQHAADHWAGAALIVLAIILFVLEATVTSHGILASAASLR